MPFSESLTVRILGDSSGLQRELDDVLSRLDELQSKLADSADSANQLTRAFRQVAQVVSPLQRVGSLLARIDQQLRAISQRPITLNVNPALQALQQLMQVARQAAAAIQAIPLIPLGGGIRPGPVPIPALPPVPLPNGGRQRFAGGGLVSGPPGIDRVATQLTAGEFVINRETVEALGLGFFNRLNSSRRTSGIMTSQPVGVGPVQTPLRSLQVPNERSQFTQRRQQTPNPVVPPAVSSVTNQFGGLTIQVQNQVETESLLRNIQLHGLGNRIRQG